MAKIIYFLSKLLAWFLDKYQQLEFSVSTIDYKCSTKVKTPWSRRKIDKRRTQMHNVRPETLRIQDNKSSSWKHNISFS